MRGVVSGAGGRACMKKRMGRGGGRWGRKRRGEDGETKWPGQEREENRDGEKEQGQTGRAQ